MDGSRITLIEGTQEWSALYVDGKLDRVGDTYLAHERIIELCGVNWEQSDDFMRGGDSRSDVAKTLDEVTAYTAERERREQDAQSLRAQAQALLEQAQALESGGTC